MNCVRMEFFKNLAGFEEGSKKNSILTQFIRHMNQNAVGSVRSFIAGDKKECGSEPGKELPYQLGCVQCAGVVLSASFLCLESPGGLSQHCVQGLLGPGQCNACIQEFLSLPW